MKNFRNKRMTKITIIKMEDKIMFHVVRRGKCKNRGNLNQSKIFYPDPNSIKESMYDYQDCIEILQDDKIARRWFTRTMRDISLGSCKVKDYLHKTGEINFKKAENDDYIKR